MVYALVAIFGGASIGLGTVWMRHQISMVANTNKVLEATIAGLERRIEEADAAIASEQDPDVLIRKNDFWKLGLVAPAETQVRRVAEDPVLRLAALRNQALFGERQATVSLHVVLAH
ncbi:MAG TPA: hypothetical protein VGF85_07890 [Opitutaceae bacterium]|jgi:hypothetical protein